MDLIQLSRQRVSLDEIEAEPARFGTLFSRARAETGHALCLCVPGGRKLQIRRRDGVFHVAVWPLDGEAHHAHCRFHKPPADMTGRSAYTAGAIEERADGCLDIRSRVSLKVRTEDRNPSTERDAGGGGQSRASAGLLGVMHALWERTRLNQWQPHWVRNWTRCRWALRSIDGSINGQRMSEAVYVVPTYEEARRDAIEAEFERFRKRLTTAGLYRLRGMVLGEVRRLQESQYGFRIDLRNQRLPYFVSHQLIARAQRSYRHVFAQLESPRARVVVLLVIEVSKQGYLTITDMAAMLTTRNYIPAESSYELEMADALTAASRAFIKPLRYDGHAEEFPDFRLTDTIPESVVEVFGMSGNAEYDRRKAEKQARYRAKGTTVIEWETRGPLPDLTLKSPAAR